MILGSFRYLEKNDLEKIIILFRLESHSCDESLSELAMVGNLIFLKHYEPQGGAGPGVRGGFVHFTMFKVELATMFEFEVVVLHFLLTFTSEYLAALDCVDHLRNDEKSHNHFCQVEEPGHLCCGANRK